MISYNADDFAVKVIGDEGGVIRQPFPVQEEITVLRRRVEGQSDSTADRCNRGGTLEAARYCDLVVAEKDRDVEW